MMSDSAILADVAAELTADEEAIAAHPAGGESTGGEMMERFRHLLASGQTSSDLLAREFEPLKWLVPGLIPAEGLTVLGAKMGLGKSYLLLQLAAALSIGAPFLGRETERKGVLLIALEDSDRRIQARLNQLEAVGTEKLLIYTRWSRGKAALEDLRLALISHHSIRCVIIDPVVKFVDGIDFNAYEQAYGALGALKECLDAHGCAGVFSHHARKSASELDAFDDLLGSTGWGASCDTRLVLRRNRGSDDAVLVAGGRDVAHSESALHFDIHAGWTFLGDAKDVAMSETRRAILDMVEREGPIQGSEIVKNLGMNENTARTHLRKLADEGKIRQEVDKRWIGSNGLTGLAGEAAAGGQPPSPAMAVRAVTPVRGATGISLVRPLRDFSPSSIPPSSGAGSAGNGVPGYAGGDNGL